MSTLFVSIIIPIYNVAPYLAKCLESVLAQGFETSEYEVLLIDDGSKDNSAEICQNYCDKHSNFKLIRQANEGVAAARNNGIDAAQGEYIVFLDADDYLLTNGLYLASSRFRHRDDVDIIHYYSSYDFWPIRPINNEIDFDGMGHDYIIHSGLPSFCWLFFYKKSFLDRHQLRFKTYIVGEDQLFSSAMCIANPRLVSTKADIYRYVVREQSATTKRDIMHTRRCVKDYLAAYHDIMNAMRKYNIRNGSVLYQKCIESVNSKKMFGFSRILSAEYNHYEFKAIRSKCKEVGFFPVVGLGKSLKHRFITWGMNISMRQYIMYKAVSLLFNQIVVPYILPKIRTNL